MDLEIVPSEAIIHEGVLNDIPIGRLNGGDVYEFTAGLCFLSRGHFEISAQVRPFGVPHLDARIARATLTAVVE